MRILRRVRPPQYFGHEGVAGLCNWLMFPRARGFEFANLLLVRVADIVHLVNVHVTNDELLVPCVCHITVCYKPRCQTCLSAATHATFLQAPDISKCDFIPLTWSQQCLLRAWDEGQVGSSRLIVEVLYSLWLLSKEQEPVILFLCLFYIEVVKIVRWPLKGASTMQALKSP